MSKLPTLALSAFLLGTTIGSAHQVPTRFVKVHRITPEQGAAFLTQAFARAESEESPEGYIPLQVLPAPRTNEVFVMGMREEVRLAEAMLVLLDRFFSLAWR